MKASILRINSLIAASLLTGCIARAKYDAAVNDATRAQAALDASQKLERELRSENRAEIAQLRQELAETQISLASAQQEVEFAGGIAVTCGEALDESTTLNEGLKSPSALSAAGYAEFDPINPNDSAVNKAKNRRIEIALQPNIDQLVDVPR